MNKYQIGTLAKLANVTERTLRYYDKIGLLKPSTVLSNGYRQYTDTDLLKLQKILSLKHLGFSIEEIFPIVLEDQSLKESFKMQIEDLAKEQNTTVSNLTLSLLEAYLNSQKATGQPTNTDLLMYYNTKYIITRNKIYNIISLDPNIPSHTKEKIRKELDSLALC